MAHILFIEDDEIALKAMDGIIKRSPHTLEVFSNTEAVWKRIIQDFKFDMIIMELKLSNENSWKFLKSLRSNYFLNKIPVLIYSNVKDKNVIRGVLQIKVLNYLFKPYKESQLFEEIDKSLKTSWNLEQSGDLKLFQSLIERNKEEFYGRNISLMDKLESIHGRLLQQSDPNGLIGMELDLRELGMLGEMVAFPALKSYLSDLMEQAKAGSWMKCKELIDQFDPVITLQKLRMELINQNIDRSKISNKNNKDEKQVQEIPIDESPLPDKAKYDKAEIDKHIENIKNYPVIESAAAAFQMATNEEDTSLDEIVEMIVRDPGLTASVLRFSNSSFIAPKTVIEDIHQAISVLGLQRVRLLALSLKTVPEMSSMFKAFRWQDFWMYQVGCAMLCEEIAKILDLPIKPEIAYIAGLVHDMGKLLLCDVDATLYRRALKDSQKKRKPLIECEKAYFSYSNDEIGLVFAKNSNLAEALQFAVEYQYKPQDATRHIPLVSVLTIAHYLCCKNDIGNNGDLPPTGDLAALPAWKCLKDSLSPNFKIARFSRGMEERIKTLKTELMGLAKSHNLVD